MCRIGTFLALRHVMGKPTRGRAAIAMLLKLPPVALYLRFVEQHATPRLKRPAGRTAADTSS